MYLTSVVVIRDDLPKIGAHQNESQMFPVVDYIGDQRCDGIAGSLRTYGHTYSRANGYRDA
jgi:hypothetical protein